LRGAGDTRQHKDNEDETCNGLHFELPFSMNFS
jgi:hypothetical protein